ncbi:MAG: hypothetical protein ACFFBH_06125 [Promethearchaeota archaeon]
MMNKSLDNNKKIRYTAVLVLGLIIFGMFITTVSASTSYQSTLTKGTKEFIITQYNKSAWKNTVDTNSNPNSWFDGIANVTNAKSKYTIIGWSYTTWQTYDVLTTIFMPQYFSPLVMFGLLETMNSKGYNETTINTNYTTSYNVWYGLRAVWNFTDGNFEEAPSYIEGVFVLQNPSLFKPMIDDYNNLSAKLNGVLMFPYFPILTADQFLWQMALNGLAIAEPQEGYLTNLVNGLGCENASVNGKTLIFDRYGIANYTVEISYGTEGLISTFTVKDSSDDIIFKFVSTDSNWLFYMILIIVAVIIVVLAAFLIIRHRKIKKNR